MDKTDITFHYPPDLFQLLNQTIPLLFRSKKDVLLFFQGAGVNSNKLSELNKIIETDKEKVSKYGIVQTILTDINMKGEKTLKVRREILKRVIEFEDFSTSWPEDQMKAIGLVTQVRNVVNVKDTFTRINLERENEIKKNKIEYEKRGKEIQKKKEVLEEIQRDLSSLFGITDVYKRAKLLEGTLNRLFKANDILVKESFALVGDNGQGILEQIDGVIEIDGYIFLVEMKWWREKLGKNEVSPHLVNVYNRGQAGGILISALGFTEPAIETCKEALTQRTVVLCELEELVNLLEHRRDLKDFLKTKIRIAITEKKPFKKII